MTTMIWGANGFFGINTARCLADRGEEVIMVNRHPMQGHPLLAKYWDKQIKQATGDMVNLAVVLDLVKNYKADSLIHAGVNTAGTSHGSKFSESLNMLFRSQIDGILNLCEAAKILELRRVTYISSLAVYRGWPHNSEAWTEDAFLPPLPCPPHADKKSVSTSQASSQGLSQRKTAEISIPKRACEHIGFFYSETYGFSFAAIRPGNNYGVHCYTTVNRIVENAIQGKPTDLSTQDGNARWNPVNAKDSGEITAIVHLAKSLKHYIYNICDGTHPTTKDIVNIAKELFPKAKIKLGTSKGKPGDPVPHDISRIKEEFGFVPMTLKQGIKHYASYLKTGKY